MTFRTKLFVIFTLALFLCVGLMTAGVLQVARPPYEKIRSEYANAVVSQFQRELDRDRNEVRQRTEIIADAEGTVRMAIDLSRPQTDVSIYVNDARGVSQAQHLDFLDFVATDGSIISSAEWPSRFGYKLPWVTQPVDWSSFGAFLMKVETPDGPVLGLMNVSTVRVGDRNLYVMGGERLGKTFLTSVALPSGMRALLYENLTPNFQAANLTEELGSGSKPERFAPFIEAQLRQPSEQMFRISWTSSAASAEEFRALPLMGRQKDLLGILLVGTSLQDAVTIQRRIRLWAFGVLAMGLFFGFLLRAWAAARVTRPVLAIAQEAKAVSEGSQTAHVDVRGLYEIRQLASAFNRMTEHLSEHRERLLQSERVAAWREVAARLSGELNAPLIFLQSAIDNLEQRKEQGSTEHLDLARRDSLPAVRSELEQLRSIVNRLSDFAKASHPQLGSVNLNEVVRDVIREFEAQFSAVGRPPITSELHLDEELPPIQADSALLHLGVQSLILNAMDAMPSGGVLMLRTTHQNGDVQLEVSDTGMGLTPEESTRLFTAQEIPRKYGSEFTLAIVQSVVSDHGGRISTESESGVGTSFHIYLPNKTADGQTDPPASSGTDQPKEATPDKLDPHDK